MHWLQEGTGTLNGRILATLLLISRPNIVLLLDCLLPELLVRCSNCSILEVTEAEEGRKWMRERAAMLDLVLLLGRGARNHSGSSSIDNRINVASTQALLLYHPAVV